ncbi:MAG: hypothetical protein C0448_01080 [Sphingobacteriaceae bacterium]|nr:hypothetical protein [Sphingobacteriaceae bacterium]
MKTLIKFRPGEIVPQSGIYEEIDVLGNWVIDVTCVRGEHFPPAESNGFYYKIKTAARHKVKG